MAMMEPTTKLEAVNKMLASIGQAPVNTLEVSGIGDVAAAISALDETARDILAVGWAFNSDRDYTLNPDTGGVVRVPNGVIDIDASDPTTNITIRRHPDGGMALWDGDNLTFTFTQPVICDVVWGFPFDDLPQAARTYIGTAAARRFQARRISSTILDRYNAEDEERAWLLMQRNERRTRDTNVFRANTQVRAFGTRRRF
jgi:hypothetical protein